MAVIARRQDYRATGLEYLRDWAFGPLLPVSSPSKNETRKKYLALEIIAAARAAKATSLKR